MDKVAQFLEDTNHIIVAIFTPLTIITMLAYIIKFTGGGSVICDMIIAIMLDVIHNLWTFYSRVFTVILLHAYSSEGIQYAIIAFCAAYITYGLFEVLVCIAQDCLFSMELFVSLIHDSRFLIIFPVAAIGKIIDRVIA